MQRPVNALKRIWESHRLPIRDALHLREGGSYDISLDTGVPRGMKILSPFDLEGAVQENPSWTSEVDGLRSVSLPGGGFLWAGEGSYGSEGFFARLTAEYSLTWAVFFAESNPFTEIQLIGRKARFESTANVEITLDIDDPLSA